MVTVYDGWKGEYHTVTIQDKRVNRTVFYDRQILFELCVSLKISRFNIVTKHAHVCQKYLKRAMYVLTIPKF
jgi:hypothetical protein